MQGTPDRHFIKQLQHARKNLINCRSQSFKHRQVFLNHLQSQRIENGDSNEANIIRQIQTAERKQNCWRLCKLLRKRPQTSGGISHVLVPSQVDLKKL
jgi:hypothetical protein